MYTKDLKLAFSKASSDPEQVLSDDNLEAILEKQLDSIELSSNGFLNRQEFLQLM